MKEEVEAAVVGINYFTTMVQCGVLKRKKMLTKN